MGINAMHLDQIQVMEKHLEQLICDCRATLKDLLPKNGSFEASSERTRNEYIRLATSLIERTYKNAYGLSDVVLKTQRPNTYHKRIAALRYGLFVRQKMLLEKVQLRTSSQDNFSELIHEFQQQLCLLKTLSAIIKNGFNSPRKERNSKRKALSGLPKDWREQLCERGKNGKYKLALLVSALTGCRPAEIQNGIRVWKENDGTSTSNRIVFEIHGVKVKSQQGQPSRIVRYDTQENHPLLQAVLATPLFTQNSSAQISVESAGNFSVEVRRLAKSIWPKHKYSVTAYCFRHQWASDLKLHGDGDAVSRGLGHASAKTRRYYGTANQAGSHGLRPSEVEAERPIRPCVSIISIKSNERDLSYP